MTTNHLHNKDQNSKTVTFTCRACGSAALESVVDLGITPLSNAFVPFARGDEGEIAYPLHAFVCSDCFLVQLGEFESPKTIFSDDYVYFSSFSTSWVDHARRYAEAMTARFSLGPDAHIGEIASNDGYLLQWFAQAGQKVTGIEPAGNCAAAARARGVHTISTFFKAESAFEIVRERGKADLIAANNVLAHVPDLADFVAGFKIFLAPEGVATFEFPHLLSLVTETQFDTIYHEHFSYLSLGPLLDVMRRAGLRVFDVAEIATHGGSLRLFVCHDTASHITTDQVSALLEKERKAGLYSLSTYAAVAERVRVIKDDLLAFLIEQRRAGRSVAAYGAAAKGSTLLNYCGVGTEYVAYVIDKNPTKQGRFMPGIRIPVYGMDHLRANLPDYLLILPWNLSDEIAHQLRGEEKLTVKLVTAIPKLKVF